MPRKPRKAASAPALPPAESASAAPATSEFVSLARLGWTGVANANLAWSAGIGEELFAYAKSSLKTASETAAALLRARTFDEVLELNAGLAKSTVEEIIARSGRLGALGIAATKATLETLGGGR